MTEIDNDTFIEEIGRCSICLNNLDEDAVTMLCPGQHNFCFGCICIYYKHNINKVDEIECPNCREGKGKLIPSKTILKYLKLKNRDIKGTGELHKFYDTVPYLSSLYPLLFDDFEQEALILPIHILIYIRHGNTKNFINNDKTKKIRDLLNLSPVDCKYIALQIIDETNDVIGCIFDSKDCAYNSLDSSPSCFTCTLVVEISLVQANYSIVKIQKRPVTLYTSLPLEIYTQDMFTENTIRNIKNVITRLRIS